MTSIKSGNAWNTFSFYLPIILSFGSGALYYYLKKKCLCAIAVGFVAGVPISLIYSSWVPNTRNYYNVIFNPVINNLEDWFAMKSYNTMGFGTARLTKQDNSSVKMP